MGIGVVSAGDPATPAYLDMRGTITGLDHRADPATNAVWKFSHLKDNCFRPNDGVKIDGSNCTPTPAQWISGLRTPGTLASDGWTGVFHIDTAPNPMRTREVIVDEPDFTGQIGGWGLNSVSSLTNLVFKCPKATTLADPVCHGASSWTTDISDTWDLSGIKYVGSTSSTAVPGYGPLSSPINGMKGVLRLPALVHIAAGPTDNGAAFRVGVGSAELGLDGNLTSLACHSFKDCNKLTNVVIGTALGKTLTIWTNAFRCAGLKTIYFNGDKPTFKYAYNASSPAFGVAGTPEGQITFYVRDVPSWAAVLAEADANGGYVAGSTLHTAKRQKVARFTGFTKVTAELQDPRFAARYHETVTMTRAETAAAGKGAWGTGAVTLTASCSDPDDAATNPCRAKFLRWDGVPQALERENPVTFMPAQDAAVKAVFAHDWVMSADAEPARTMTNGFWRLCCYKRDAANHYLGIGKNASKVGKGDAWPTAKEQRLGGGDLNLNGDVWEELPGGGWQKWTIVSCGSLAPWTYETSGWKCPNPTQCRDAGELVKMPTRITYPESLLVWPGELCNYDSFDADPHPRWPVTEVFAICPNVTRGTLVSFTIGGAGQVSRLVVRAPGLTQIGSDGPYGLSWSLSTFSKTNFDEWDVTGVKRITMNAFRMGTSFNATGTLHLPNLQEVGTNACLHLAKVQGFVAGTNGLVLTKLDDKACAGLTSITNLVLGTRNLTLGSTLGASSVFNAAYLKTVSFPGPVLPAATVDAILAKTTAQTGAKQVTIFASFYNGWGDLAAPLTAEEEPLAPRAEHNLVGVYSAAARKAWLVHTRSIYDPKGMSIILR